MLVKNFFRKKSKRKLEGKKYVEKEEKSEKVFLSWSPKTKLGREVKEGKIKNIDEVIGENKKILEGVDCRFADNSANSDLISIS